MKKILLGLIICVCCGCCIKGASAAPGVNQQLQRQRARVAELQRLQAKELQLRQQIRRQQLQQPVFNGPVARSLRFLFR